jgi:hypothetical protein
VDWSNFFDLGGVAGIVALLWQGASSIRRRRRTPKLHVHEFDPAHDLKYWQLDPEGKNVRLAITLDVANKGADTATRCVATLELTHAPNGVRLRERRYALHWAAVEYSYRNTGSQPVDIGPEVHRLDVAFTQQGQDVPGCWIATPFALSHPSIDQAYLPPGDYSATLRISCENGRATTVQVTINSPQEWRGLSATVGAR